MLDEHKQLDLCARLPDNVYVCVAGLGRRRYEQLEQSEQSAHKQVQQLHHQLDSERTAAHQKLQQELQRTDDHWTAKYDAKVRQLESQLDSTQRERDQWAAAARVAEDKVAQYASSEQSVATNYETALSRLHSERDAATSAMATAHANEVCTDNEDPARRYLEAAKQKPVEAAPFASLPSLCEPSTSTFWSYRRIC